MPKHETDTRKTDLHSELLVIQHPEIGLPKPRTEPSFAVKLAKNSQRNRPKMRLYGLHEVLGRGSILVEMTDHSSIIKDLGNQ